MKSPFTRHPMTLIELLIVLALLGGLATLALTGVGDLSNRNRVDTSRKRLDDLRLAVVGDGLRPSRFLCDMGRLPMVQETGVGESLSELWEAPSGLAHAAVTSESLTDGAGSLNWPDSLSGLPGTVTLHCGWNGPYLALNDDTLYDGFGSDFLVANTGSPSATASGDWYDAPDGSSPPPGGTEIPAVLSLGADRSFTDADWADTNRMASFANQSADVELIVTIKARDLSGDVPSWHTVSPIEVWGNNHAYSVGDRIVDTGLDYVFECTNAGTSDGSEPSWTTTEPNVSTTSDGTASWTYLGELSRFHYHVNRIYAALFVPVIGQNSKSIGSVGEGQSNGAIDGTVKLDDSSTMAGGVTKLTPGIRKLYVYAFVRDGSSTANERAGMSEPHEIDLSPGTNHITVYLTDPL